MNRKSFLKFSALGVGLASIPSVAKAAAVSIGNKIKSTMSPKVVRDSEGMVFNVIGDIQTHKIMGSDTNNQIFEWVDNVEPGTGIPPHTHTKEDEIFRVIEGEVEIMVGGKTTVLKAGDCAFAPRDIMHSWKVVGTKKAKMCTSAFPAGIEHMFKKLAELPAGPPDMEKVFAICAEQGITFGPPPGK